MTNQNIQTWREPANRFVFDGVDSSQADHRPVVILGGGPAGLTAALYTARANLQHQRRQVQTDERSTLPVRGLFVAIGHQPNTAVFQGWLEMDELGYIRTQPGSTHTGRHCAALPCR